MIEQVKRFLGLSRRKTGNKLIISVEKLERRVALLEDGQLEVHAGQTAPLNIVLPPQ